MDQPNVDAIFQEHLHFLPDHWVVPHLLPRNNKGKGKVQANLYSAISCHFTKTFQERFDKCDNVRSQENVRQL